MGFLTNIPATMLARGIRFSFSPNDFVLPVNAPTSMSGSMART